MTKATLKYVANQYILIVDERPEVGELFYHSSYRYLKRFYEQKVAKNCYKVIAAEISDGVKGIKVDFKRLMSISDEEFISLIDTEVEVTEEKDYYLIRI